MSDASAAPGRRLETAAGVLSDSCAPAAREDSAHAGGAFDHVNGSKVVIISYGSRGDVQPFVALGSCIESAGGRVLIITNCDHEEFITSFGLQVKGTASSCRDDHRREEFVNGIATGDFGAFWKWQHDDKSKKMPELAQREEDAIDQFGPDLIYATPLTYHSACQVAGRRGTPMILGSLFPTHNPFTSLGFRPFRPAAHPTLVHWSPELTKTKFWQHGTHKVTGFLIVPETGGGSPADGSDPPASAFGGEEERRKMQGFLSSGPPPVYLGWGSMVVPTATTALAVRALRQTSLRGVIVGGWACLSEENLGCEPDSEELASYAKEHVLFAAAAPHEWLFPRCAVTVHHGGVGTVAAALRAGVPTVVAPCGLDQPDNARIVQENGCGIATSQMAHLTDGDLAAALSACIADTVMHENCRAMASRLRAEDGVVGAVAEIDKYLGERARGEHPSQEEGPPPVVKHLAKMAQHFFAKHSAAPSK